MIVSWNKNRVYPVWRYSNDMRIVGLTNEAYDAFDNAAKALGLTTRELGKVLIEKYLTSITPQK